MNATIEPRIQLFGAVFKGELDTIRQLCQQHPELAEESVSEKGTTILSLAVSRKKIETIRCLIDLGFNVNAVRLPERSTALVIAIGNDLDEITKLLIDSGTDLQLGRPLIGALNQRKSPERRMRYVRWLVEADADINQLHNLYGDPAKRFTALDWTNDPAVADYLKSKGAKTAAELEAANLHPSDAASTRLPPEEETVSYFNAHFGRTLAQSLNEIEPRPPAIAVRVIPAADSRRHVTLYTTGLSHQAMPPFKGKNNYRYAELFIELPEDWMFASDDPQFAWPVKWMRKIASYPLQKPVSLGGPLTIIACKDPPRPLGPNNRFTSIMLLAEKHFRRSDGNTVQLFRMVPLYQEERILEMRDGAAALMRAFDRQSVPFIVDTSRLNVAVN
ncbi:suppressor of fused domain protein [Rhodopirellula sp. SWK7]|uniref:suppressor of fused domain protein n=1 Tax=Rhodopirellula sp. SWK7 TaxID=595460 RepID=UPI001360B218|nr:suppressor of fused domain protein [Rhodopirellula sp. SWK7]